MGRKGLFEVQTKILKILQGQHPGIQQYHQRKSKQGQGKEFNIGNKKVVLEMNEDTTNTRSVGHTNCTLTQARESVANKKYEQFL